MHAHAALPPPLMPYGAPDLKRVARPYLARAVMTSSAAWAAFFFVLLAVSALAWRQVQTTRTVEIIPYIEIAPPPALRELVPPPPAPIPVSQPPQSGFAVPVPDAQVSPVQTIAPQEEMNPPASAPEASDHGTVVAPPVPEAVPDPHEPVFVDQFPEAITRVKPEYPPIAREAGVEGMVVVRALVGVDGHVQQAFVEAKFSIALLDSAAVQAARRWVFTPAFTNNRPVPVWVAIPMRFSLH